MWTSNDIGGIKTQGFARYNQEAMIWIVRGEGADIWGPADTLQYTSRPFKGDGFIIAKVESIGRTDPWAKCGIMIRESMDPGARFVAVYATPENGVRFHARINTADAVVCDTSVATEEQKVLKTPVWIKLERKGNQFYACYATDKAGKAWTPMVWNPQTVAMPKAACAGLVVCSHVAGTLCETKFSGVAVSDTGYEITDDEVRASPQEALASAYQNLEQLGNWRNNKDTLKKQGHLIASSLFAIARAGELSGKPVSEVLPDYYRIAELLPDARPTGEALTRIALLDGAKGLDYAMAGLEARPPEDKDRFYVAAMTDSSGRSNTAEGEAVIESFVKYVAKNSRFALLEQVITDLGSEESGISTCKSLIRSGMAEPSSVQTAIVALRYMALKASEGQVDARLQELLQWAATQFKDTQLGPYALAALADIQYAQGSYDKTLETFQPELLLGNEPDAKLVENLENALASYRTHTLLQTTINPERLYKALAEKGVHPEDTE